MATNELGASPAPKVDLVRQVEEICSELGGEGIVGIGTSAAISAMAPHWQEQLSEENGAEIVRADLNEVQQRIGEVTLDLVQRVNSSDYAAAKLLASLTREDEDQLVASLTSSEPATDQQILDYWVNACNINEQVAHAAIAYRSQFQSNPEFKFPKATARQASSGPVLLRYALVKTNRRLTFDILYQAAEVTHTGTEDDVHAKFVASNGYEVHARTRMDIEIDRIWLRGPKDKYNHRSGTIIFGHNQTRDAAYEKYIVALHEWACSLGGVAEMVNPS